MDWFRWHHGTVNDPKFRVVSRMASVTVRDVLCVWIAMLECASQATVRGLLEGWDHESVGAGLDLEAAHVQAIHDAMQGRMLDGNSIRNWEKRQPKREDTTAAKRQRDKRERERGNKPVTQSHGTSRTVTTDKIREDKNPVAKATGSRLPADWKPAEALIEWVHGERPDLDWRSETENFRDYWIAKPGKDGLKLDWGRTWQRWMRTARVKPQPRQTAGPPGQPQFKNPFAQLRLEQSHEPDHDHE
jgi:hypothetical protein